MEEILLLLAKIENVEVIWGCDGQAWKRNNKMIEHQQ